MPKKALILAGSVVAAGALFAVVEAQDFDANRITRVFVTNLGNPQPVRGKVEVAGTVSHSMLRRFQDVIVSPAGRHETNQLIDAGSLQTAGFTGVTLSLVGEVKGTPFRPGAIGVLLIPEEEAIQRAFAQDGAILLPLETAAAVEGGSSSYFSATRNWLPLAFSSYRVMLYNETDKSAAVNVYAYLMN